MSQTRHGPGSLEHRPVTIVGAGPAGLAAAIVLARGGREVLVREWKQTVGHRFHNDFQGLENWSDPKDCLKELAGYGLTPEFDCFPSHESTAFDGHAEAHTIKTKRPLYYLLRRGPAAGTLDRGLLAQAEAEGVTVNFNDRARNIAGPTIFAAGPRRAEIVATGYLFDTGHADGSWFSLDQSLAPGGYAYLLIHEGRGTMATCMFAGFGRQAEHLARTVRFFREKLRLDMGNATKFGGYGVLGATTKPMQDGHPVTGEQAGFQDALAGFGLRYAMGSGALAARCELEGRDYVGEWRRTILPRLKVGMANRMLFAMAGNPIRAWALRGMAANGPRERLHQLYQPHGLTGLAYPLAALKNHSVRKNRPAAQGQSATPAPPKT
jgi:flavin-dependent dehydrogenase